MSWGDSLNVAYNIATDAYQTVKKKFTTAYATASTFVCDTAPLAVENFAYQELAGRVTSWGGSAANTFFPESVVVYCKDIGAGCIDHPKQ